MNRQHITPSFALARTALALAGTAVAALAVTTALAQAPAQPAPAAAAKPAATPASAAPAAATPAKAAAAPAQPAAAAAKSAAPKAAATYPSAQAAVDALIAALRAGDAKALATVLGPGHQRIIDSGDTKADRAEWARYVASYDGKHTLQMDGDAKATLITGPEDWPNPIPIVKGPNGWYFDSAAGEDEIVARRIGRNELDAMNVCLAFIDMQREYAETDHDGNGILEYARKFFSSPGKRDGLYWPTKAGEPPSPGGKHFADATANRGSGGGRQPYHGYFYRILTAQGKAAPGGARDYVVNGKLIGGVGLVAWPARYLSSGVKTFICNTDGTVFEKDLGPDTATLAGKITAYDPDSSWTKTSAK